MAITSLRNQLLRLSGKAGLNSLVAGGGWRHRRVLILCYHGVSQADEHEWNDLYVSPAQFRDRLELVRRGGFNVLSLPEALERLHCDTLPHRSVVLTFDDGFVDFSSVAAPLMAGFGYQSTVYLTSYYSRLPLPVFDPALSYVLWKARGKSWRVPGSVSDETIPHSAADRRFRQMHGAVLRITRNERWSTAEKHEFLRYTAEQLGVDFDRIMRLRLFHLMTADEVRALDPALVSVQLHSHRHRMPRGESDLRREVEENAAYVRALRPGSGEPRHYCYPSGTYDLLDMERLRGLGIASAMTTRPGLVARSDDLMELPRFSDSPRVPAATFEAWLSGVASWTRRPGFRPPLRKEATPPLHPYHAPVLEQVPRDASPPIRARVAQAVLGAADSQPRAGDAEVPIRVSEDAPTPAPVSDHRRPSVHAGRAVPPPPRYGPHGKAAPRG